MRFKHLEAALSSLTRDFPSPKVALEQYPTSASLAAAVMQLAMANGDLDDDSSTIALDLGCGTGMLTVGAAFGCALVIAIDCDEDALSLAQENVAQVDLEDTVVFIQAKVKTLAPPPQKKSITKQHSGKAGRGGRGRGSRGKQHGRAGGGRFSQAASDTRAILATDAASDGIPLADNSVDTVVCNPPFGTKANAGIDVQFLRTACRLARGAVYSFHKRSTRDFLLSIVKEWGYEATVAAEMAFDIPQMYGFHTHKTKDIEVDLIRVDVKSKKALAVEEEEEKDQR